MKNKSPMPWRKALREIFGGRTEGDRTRNFRAVWKHQLQRMATLSGVASPDNTNEMIALFKRDGVPADWLAGLKVNFATWRQERDRAQRRDAAKSRWQKKSSLRPSKARKVTSRIR